MFFGMIGLLSMPQLMSARPHMTTHRQQSTEELAYVNGRWRPMSEAALQLDDWGVLQGVMLVERLRTYGGSLFQFDRHLGRLRDSVEAVGISWSQWCDFDIRTVCEQAVAAALERSHSPDIGVVILATPGQIGEKRPTQIIHTTELPWKKLASWYAQGQDLITATIRNVPGECWPVHIKTRSRLHYYLADQQAAKLGPNAGAVMLGLNGQVTETSFANVFMVDSERRIIAPERDEVLPGISLEIALEAAKRLGISISFEEISKSRFDSATEILLTGTNGGIWGARSIDGRTLNLHSESSVLAQLRKAWCEIVGLDYVQQAISLGH
jgi:branched-subunit amino acid aminotransferase/4-amino-4-deoxychorismate lyase